MVEGGRTRQGQTSSQRIQGANHALVARAPAATLLHLTSVTARAAPWATTTSPLGHTPTPLPGAASQAGAQQPRGRGKGTRAGKDTTLWGAKGSLRCSQKALTDSFLPRYSRIIVISCKHAFLPTQLLTATVLVWCWPPAMLMNGSGSFLFILHISLTVLHVTYVAPAAHISI